MLDSKLNFYLRTWTGRIIALNTLLFVIVTFASGDVFSPSGRVLVSWGAKDPYSIAMGQWWRFITPIFLHFGIIHFLLNNFALKVVGESIEEAVGAGSFVGIYLISGIFGNIASSYFNIGIGAGASGAIFGLIGSGLIFEQLILRHQGSKKWYGPFTAVAAANYALAFLFNMISALFPNFNVAIDNAAHSGGMLAGMTLTYALLCIKPNRLVAKKVTLGWSLVGFTVFFMIWSGYQLSLGGKLLGILMELIKARES